MIDKNPCFGCTERFTACSDRCPKDARGAFGHKAWKMQYQAQQKHLEANKHCGSWSAGAERAYRNNLRSSSAIRRKGGDQ